jgi:hypothetical protein
MRRMFLVLCAVCALVVPRGALAAEGVAACEAAAVQTQSGAPEFIVTGDPRVARLAARFGDLTVLKTVTRERVIQIRLVTNDDVVDVTVRPRAPIEVVRGDRTLAIASAKALQQLQELLAGSHAVFSARALLSARESVSKLKAHEMSLLTALSLVAALTGDIEAPRRLADRFMARYRGIVRQVGYVEDEAESKCWDIYVAAVSKAWSDYEQCIKEIYYDWNPFNRVIREVGCDVFWIGAAESSWLEYLSCMGFKQPKLE